MLRMLIVLPIVLIALAVGALYAAYGEVDPCRVLAVEQARRAQTESGLHIGNLVEPWTRFATSQLSTRECVRDLVRSWRERLSDGGKSGG
jgi:hypothetical protein